MKKILIFGGWTGGNKGDLGILIAEMSAILAEIPDAHFLIPSKFPQKIAPALRDFPVEISKTVRSYFGFSTFSLLKKADAIVFGGGGVFFGRKFWHFGYSHLLNFFFIALFNRLFFHRKIMIFAVGASHFFGFLPTVAATFLLRSAEKITVRDDKTRKLFQKLGAKKVLETADPAFLLFPKKEKIAKKYAAEIAVCFDDQFFPPEKKLFELFQKLEKNFSVVFFHNDAFSKKGEKFWKKFGKNFHRVRFFPTKKSDPREIIFFLKKCKMLVAAPMHAIIFAVVAGKKVLPIIYDEKVLALCQKIKIDVFLRKNEILKIPEMISSATRAKMPLEKIRQKSRENAKILKTLFQK